MSPVPWPSAIAFHDDDFRPISGNFASFVLVAGTRNPTHVETKEVDSIGSKFRLVMMIGRAAQEHDQLGRIASYQLKIATTVRARERLGLRQNRSRRHLAATEQPADAFARLDRGATEKTVMTNPGEDRG